MTAALVISGIVCTASLIYRAIVALERTSGASFRASTTERRDTHHLIERLLEKRDVDLADPGNTIQYNHGVERMQRIATDAKLEQSETLAEYLANQPERPLENEDGINV